MLGRFIDHVFDTIAFYFRATIFLSVFLLLTIYGTIHAAIYGGQIMPDDAWFFAKIIFLILLPFMLSIAIKRWSALPLGVVASVVLACLFSWGDYTHAPQFREAKLYSVENGKLIVPEENRDLFLRDCGSISHEGMKGTCRVIVYCQDYDAAAYERMGCGELLAKRTSPALLDLALQERRGFEQK